MKYQVQHTHIRFQGRAFDVRQDDITLPDGKNTRLDIVQHAPAVTILPIGAGGEIWFVRQYRHPAGLELLELPAGVLEPDEEPLNCAQREIQEEIGMAATCLQEIGRFFLAPGYSTEFMYVFLARDLFPSTLPQDDDEFLTVVQLTPNQIAAKVRDGDIQDAKTLAVLYLAGIGLPPTSLG